MVLNTSGWMRCLECIIPSDGVYILIQEGASNTDAEWCIRFKYISVDNTY